VALIPYYFGSKQGLFGAAMTLRLNPAAVLHALLEGDVETLPERLVGGLLRTWDDPEAGPPLQALLREALHDPSVGAAVREYVEREIIERLAERLPGPDRTARALGIATQMAGIITTRYLLQVEPIARMPAAELAQAVLPALRRLILPPPVRRR
jgi:AcrR family transcriptional regulator